MNAVVRAVRTYLQVLVGLLVVNWTDVASLDQAITLGKAALVASVPAALSLVQNLLEDNTSIEVPK